MKDEHQQHLDSITDEALRLITIKYTKGVEEHGGKLWEKKGIIDMAIDEAIDQVVYLLTLKQQLEDTDLDGAVGRVYETQ